MIKYPRSKGPLSKKSQPLHTGVLQAIFIALLSLNIIGITPARAHPHVFIESQTEIVIDKNHTITGIRHHWTFDNGYTAFALIGLDTNRDGIYSQTELAPLAKENINSLHEFQFFTFIYQNKKSIKLKNPEDATLVFEDNKLILHFTLPLETPVSALGKPVKLSIYDPDFYIAFLEPQIKSKKKILAMKLVDTAPKNCMFEKHRPTMDQTGLVESRLGQPRDLSNEENKGAGSLFAPTYHISCLK